jgi:hypothetical protein
MSKFLENRFTMFTGLLTFLLGNMEKFSGIPALTKAIGRLGNLLASIKNKTAEMNNTTKGKTTAKHTAEDELIEILVPAAHALYSIGKNKKLPDVMETCDTSERELRRMRDTDLSAKADAVIKFADRFTAELADYSFDAAKIALLKTKAEVYSASIGARESSVGEHSGARTALLKLYDEVDELLDDELDRLMELIKVPEPQLYNQYFALRNVKELGKVHRKEDDKPGNTGTEPPDTGAAK